MSTLHRRDRLARPGRACLLLLGVLGASAVARRIAGPRLDLPVRRVPLSQPPGQTMASLTAGLSRSVLVRDGDAAVARFAGRAGIFRYETVELIRFSDQGVSFEHLHGPFRRCAERFDLVTLDDGSNGIEHRGYFVMRGGLLGWVLGMLVVRRVFDEHVASHLQSLAGGAQ